MKHKLLNSSTLRALTLLVILFTAFTGTSWAADPITIASGSGSSGYAVPDGWTKTGTVEGGTYLKFDNGTITSPKITPSNSLSLSFSYTVATFGSGTNHPLTIRVLNASTDEVIVEKTTATPTSSSYIDTGSPLSLGDIDIDFKIQLYAPTGKGVRLRNYSITGTPAYTITAVSNDEGMGTVSGTSVITAIPKQGYRVKSDSDGYTIISGEAEVENNGDNTFNVTASSNCTIQINFEAIPTHAITGVASPAAGGSVEVLTSLYEGGTTSVTASANAGYKFTGWSITGTGASLSSNSDNPTTITMGSADATVTASFEAVTTYAIKWSVNGTIVKTENVEENAAISFDSPTSGVPTGYTFKGWVTASNRIDGTTDTDPSANYVTSANSTADITYYAVLAINGYTSPTLTKMGKTDSFTTGDNVVIVAKGTTYAMYQETINSSYVNNYTFDNEAASVQLDNKKYWTLKSKDTNWYIGDSTNGYLYNGSSNNLNVSAAMEWTISWDDTKNAYTIVGNSRYLSCRSDLTGDNQYKYRMGGTGTTTGIAFFDIYKFVPAKDGHFCTTVSDVPITVSNASYATFACELPLDFTGKEIKAYIAEQNGTTGVTFTQVNKVPANTGILLYYAGGTTENIPVFDGTGADVVTDNVFVKGTGVGVASVDGNYHNYILNNKGGVIGFYRAAGQIVGTNRAYIQIDESAAIKEFIALPDFEDDATSIQNSKFEIQNEEAPIYNLAGQRLSKMQKGINIVNGKKVLF